MQKIRNLRFTLKIHYTVFRYNGIAQLIKCGICNYFIWIHIFELIIFQKKIDTYLYNFNLFIYICMYLHKMIYVCVCPVGGYFIHQIFVYPNMITFFSFLNHTTLNNWQVHMKYSTLLFWNLKLTFYGPKSHQKEE